MRGRRLYPENWEQLAGECKERAGWCCEHCGIAQGAQRISERTGVVWTVRLAAAHLDHDPWNPAPRLAALCPTCHGRYDYSYRERVRRLELEVMRHRYWIERYYEQQGE